MRYLYLYGELEEKYGRAHRLAVKSVGEAIRAMEVNYPGFIKDIKKDGKYQVCRGPKRATKKSDLKKVEQLNEETVKLNFSKGDFHIAPVIEGSGKGKGWVSVVLGAVLIVVGIVVYAYGNPALGGFLIQMGIGIALYGVSTLLTPTPKSPGQGDRPEENKSFLFNGTINTMEQGGPVPIAYGRYGVGSVVLSSSQQSEDL
jgi:predicted phage tail protein